MTATSTLMLSMPRDRRARNRYFRKLFRSNRGFNLMFHNARIGWFQPGDWWDEAKQRARRASGECVWCGGWQPAKYPVKYAR